MLFRLAAYLIFPFMTGLAMLAHPLIDVMITSKWIPCVIYLQILCISLMLYPIHALNMNLLQVKGRSDLFLKLEIIKKVVDISVLLVTIRMGVKEMCIGLAVASYLSWIINAYYTGKLIKIGFIKQVCLILPTVFYTLVMCACIYGIQLLSPSMLVKLIIGFLTGVAAYYSISKITHAQELTFIVEKIRSQHKQ